MKVFTYPKTLFAHNNDLITNIFIKFHEDIFFYLRYYLRTLTKDGIPNFSFERPSRLQNILNGLHLYCQVCKYVRKSIWYNFCDIFRLLGLALAELRCQNCSKLTKNSTKVYFILKYISTVLTIFDFLMFSAGTEKVQWKWMSSRI